MKQFLCYEKTGNRFLKKLGISIFFLFFTLGLKAQCPTGNIIFNTQAQIDAFATNYPNCTEISGGLYISGNDITDLSPLSNLTSVGGYLQIGYNSNLTNLDGLSNLTSIGGDLLITFNSSLTDISGLQNIDPTSILSTYGLGLYIVGNTSLSVCNLDNFCTYLQGSGLRTISGNAGDCISEAAVTTACIHLTATNITSVSATLGWTSAGNNFDIEWGTQGFTQGSGTLVTDIATNSYNLTNLDYSTQYEFYVSQDFSVNESDWAGPFGFTTLPQCPAGNIIFTTQAQIDAFAINYPNCTEISGYLYISGSTITDLSPLSNLTSVGGYLRINSNSNLTNLDGLSNLTSVGGYLEIYYNSNLTNLDGLSNLTSVGGYLQIGYNSNLTNLDGLSNLTSVGGYLFIDSNSNLTDLDGLSNLTSIEGDLLITFNSSLTDISGLQNIDPTSILSTYGYGLYIVNNSSLSVCNLENFCTYLSNPSNPRIIWDNAGDCISEAAVTTACIPACDAPTNLTATNITSVSAALGWTSDGNNFDIEWGTQGFTQGSGTLVTDIATNSYNLTNLDYNTQYQFYIRQDCTVKESDWAGPFSFTTLPQCPAGDVILNSQTEVDDFATNHPNCTEISGNLYIYGSTIADLSPLSNLTSVGGFLYIGSNSSLTNLDGLNNLTSVGGFLYIGSNSSLTNLDGLSNLTSVGGYLSINSNSNLTNLDGLSNLTSVGGYLEIYYNSNLTNLDGISNLTSVGGYLSINSNSNLTNLDGLSNLTSVGADLVIVFNSSLTDISGLQNIDPASILSTNGVGLYIVGNTSLSVCNLENFCTYLAGSGLRTISGNAGDCISEAAVTTACIPCDAPTNLTATNITSVSATLGWTSDGNNFDIEWGTQGFTQGSGTLVTDIATNSYNLTNLDYNTQYQFYIRQDCTVKESDWAGPFSFTTLPQCPAGGFSSQEQIDAFATNYPNCSEISGDLYISGSTITDLSPLSNLTSVGGNLYIISNSSLLNLDGLSNLTSVGGFLDIYNNSNLTNLDGLSNLTSVGGYLEIYNNLSLTNLDGLSNLTSVGGLLVIGSNSNLTNLDGLNNLTSVGGYLYISSNSSLNNLDGLSNLTSVGADLVIYSNYSLTDISGLQNIDPTSILSTYGYGLYIVNNSSLSVCNLENFCTYLAGSGLRTISGNAGDCISEAAVTTACIPCDAPTNLTATNITSVSATLGWTSDGNNFDIEWGTQGFTQGSGTTVTGITANSYSLTSLSSNTQYQFYVRCQSEPANWVGPFAFTTLSQCPTGDVILGSQAQIDAFATNYPNCTEISGYLYIFGSTITDLSPLSNLTSVGGYLDIAYNSSLTNLDGLSNLTSVGGFLFIDSNSNLTNLDGLSSLTQIGGYLRVYNNSSLTNLDGLSNLTSVGADLVIQSNSSLTDISGLQNIDPASILSTYYGVGLYIVSNTSLSVCNLENFCTYLAGSGLRFISGNAGDCISEAAVTTACIPACGAPTNLTATNITSVSATLGWTSDGNNFDIEWGTQGFTQGSGTTVTGITANSYDLTDLDYATQYEFYVRQDCTLNESDWVGPFAFTTLSQCPTGDVSFHDQAQVDAFGENYPNCTQISGGLYISGNDITDLSPLSNLTSVGGYLSIAYNSSLTNLDGLSNLTSVGGYLEIYDNSNLTNLDGISNLTSIEGDLIISYNDALTDISGLQNIDPTSILSTYGYGLYIVNNSSLSVCNLENFCTYLSNPSNPRIIWDNAGDCISEEAINEACNQMGTCYFTTTWTGTSWSNGEPDATTKAIIDGALTLTSDLTACELEVTENGSLTIPANKTFTVKGQVINQATSDDFVIKSDGILLQTDEVENQGAITVERASSPMYRLDYTIWSSPVSGMLLRDLSEVSPSGGSGTLWNRVYILGDSAWNQVWASQQIFEADYTTTFDKAKGYMYRAKNNWVTRDSGNPGESDLGVFTGVPNNGTISINTPLMFNAIGNPYPSPIDGDELLGTEVSGLYFWTNANVPDTNGNYQLNNWAYYTQAGGTGVQIGGIGDQIQVPNGIIQPGQGFVIGTTVDVNQITLTNEMRMGNNGMFFRQMSHERHRFWLNLSDEMAVYNQILVGYMENATQGADSGIDAKMFGYEGNAIYSIVDNNEEHYVIQGKALPFMDSDVVKLGFRAIHSGSFSISLNNFDGIFEQENLIIYLKDNFNQTQHNLKNGAYTFVSEEGEFENRFEVVYQTTMSTEIPVSTGANWIVYRQSKGFQVQTIGFEMKEVSVYDMLGRNVYTSQAEGQTHQIPALGAEGVFIVKVTTTEDKVLNKKVR